MFNDHLGVSSTLLKQLDNLTHVAEFRMVSIMSLCLYINNTPVEALVTWRELNYIWIDTMFSNSESLVKWVDKVLETDIWYAFITWNDINFFLSSGEIVYASHWSIFSFEW